MHDIFWNFIHNIVKEIISNLSREEIEVRFKKLQQNFAWIAGFYGQKNRLLDYMSGASC